MHATTTGSPWMSFWESGGWWKAGILAAAYFVLYEAGSLLFAPLLSADASPDEASYIMVGYVLPIMLGGIILVAFALSVGWLRELFAPQPTRGRGWMWIAVVVVVVLLFNALRFATINYGSIDLGTRRRTGHICGCQIRPTASRDAVWRCGATMISLTARVGDAAVARPHRNSSEG